MQKKQVKHAPFACSDRRQKSLYAKRKVIFLRKQNTTCYACGSKKLIAIRRIKEPPLLE